MGMAFLPIPTVVNSYRRFLVKKKVPFINLCSVKRLMKGDQMDSNSFLLSFGMKPEDFERTEGPITSDEGFVYEAWEAKRDPACPACRSKPCVIKAHYTAELRLRSDILKKEVLICHRVKYACKACGKTFTIPLKGAMVGRGLTYLERAAMLAELDQGDTFSRVAAGHGVTKQSVIRLFDEAYPYVRRKPLPKILLIDEFRFKTGYSKYCCHLVDYEASETVDVIRSRQKAYLDEYFGSMPEGERKRVRILVTDMYDEYAAAARKWFPNASVVVDRFHVVKQLTEAVNKLRVAAMNRHQGDALAYNFMKSKWKAFLCRKKDVPDRWYVRKADGQRWHYDELIGYCLGLDRDLSSAYDCLQDLYYYMTVQKTLSKAVENVRFIAQKLDNCSCAILSKVAATYRKWELEIARGLAKNEFGATLTNAEMEAANDVAKTMIDAAYGYHNFDRFRKRFLLMRWNKK